MITLGELADCSKHTVPVLDKTTHAKVNQWQSVAQVPICIFQYNLHHKWPQARRWKSVKYHQDAKTHQCKDFPVLLWYDKFLNN